MKQFRLLIPLVLCLIALQPLPAGRYYDARIARWAVPDPALRDGDPQVQFKKYGAKLFDSSPYNYSFNNPLLYKDPDGKFPWLVLAAGVYLASNFRDDRPGGSPGLVQTTIALGSIALAPAAVHWALRNPVTATAISTSAADALAPPGFSLSPISAGSKAFFSEAKSAYQVAKEGGKHAGYLRNMLGADLKSIEKAILSYEKNVLEHLDKIAHPEQYIADWANLSAEAQTGLIRKWNTDIIRNQELQDVMKGLYEERRAQ